MEKNGAIGANTPKCCGGSCGSKQASTSKWLPKAELQALDDDLTKRAAEAVKEHLTTKADG